MAAAVKSLIALSFCGGACLYLCPSGGVRRVMIPLFTAILIAAVLKPLGAFDFDLLSLGEARLGSAEAEIIQSAKQSGDTLKKLMLRQNCERYVETKAAECGMRSAEATVSLRLDDSGNWLPFSVSIRAAGAEEAAERVSALIRDELGIPVERQVWTLNE